MPERHAAPERQIRAALPLLDIREYSWELPTERAGFFLVIEIGRDLLAGIDQALYRGGRFFEHGTFAAVELDLDNPLNAFGADHNRNADVEIPDAVLAVQPGGAGQYALLVEEVTFSHRDSGGRRGVKGRPCFEKIDDFGATIGCALDDLVDTRLRRPAHLHQVGHGNPGHRRIACKWHHRVA